MGAEKEDSETGCLSRCTNAVVQLLESGFYKFGLLVGGHPWITILISTLVGLCCAAGMAAFQTEARITELWVPYGSALLKHQKFVEEHYPAVNRFSIYLVEADNILEPEVLQKMLELQEKVQDITIDNDGDVSDWEDICYRVGQTCFTSSLLELWSFNSTVINGLSANDIVNKVNEENLISPVFFSPVDVASMLGGITRDSEGKISSAEATLMTFFIKDQREYDKASGNDVDVVGEEWELRFIAEPDSLSNSPFSVYKYTASSFQTESDAAINGDLTLLAAGFLLIIIYVIIAMSKFTFIEHKAYVTLACMLAIGLSFISAMGLASAFGQTYGPIHSVLPFLLLGIGVDDMFVLVAAWYNLTPDEKKLDVKEQVARSLKHSGVSITVTSVTDICAFLIGASTILPALRSFCVYCGIGIIFLFFFSITFFLAFLVIDQMRYKSRRDACCCCYRHKDDYVPSEWGQRAFLQEFFYNYYSPALLKTPVKIIVLILTFVILGLCLWGVVTWEQNFDAKWFLPADGDSRMYFTATEKYFPANGFATALYLDDVDYYNERQAMKGVYNEFKNSQWMQSSSVSSWYESYGEWLNTTKAGDPDLNSDNWPTSNTLFYNWLDEFLASSEGTRFRADIVFSDDGYQLVASRISGYHIYVDNSIQEINAMEEVRSIARNADFQAEGEDAAFCYAEIYAQYEPNKVVQNELLRNLGLASACVFIVILVILANIVQTLLVFCCVIFTLIDLSGCLNFWGITIETVVAVQLILAIGLAVDYSVHVGHTFMIFKGSRNDRVRATLGCMGAAVFNGGFSTFLAFVLLAASSSYIFTTFFKIFLLVVIFGLFHGLVFLPVVLSLIGPSPYLSAKPAETVGEVMSKQEKQDIAKDPEKNGESRNNAVNNPAFVKEDDVEMSITNGSSK